MTMGLCGTITPFSLILIINAVFTRAANLGDIANSLKAGYDVERNGIPLRMGPTSITTYLANITLENIGSSPIEPHGWALNLCHDKLIHPMFYNISTMQYAGGGLILPGNFTVTHNKGCMFTFTPYKGNDQRFIAKPIMPGEKIVIPIVASEFLVSRYSAFPNWYLSNETHTNLIPNTMDDARKFVGPFEYDIQYTRFINDFESIPFSPIDRYRGLKFSSVKDTKNEVLPTLYYQKQEPGSTTVDSSWFIDFDNDQELKRAAVYLQKSIKEDTGLSLQIRDYADHSPKAIQIRRLNRPPTSSPEAYTLSVNATSKRIIINGFSKEAVINGISTLRSLLAGGTTLDKQTINDMPRLPYRGLELDISDNFFGSSTLKKVIDLMAMYKLNKLVLILGAENGWRIEIPGIPELTRIGSKRCHDPTETNCLFSQLGSLPDGSDGGFLKTAEYEDILRYAQERNVEVIPQINMAAKARAAIKSMRARQMNTGSSNMVLQEPNDGIPYMTSSMFVDSTVNPCLPNQSTVKFFEYVLKQLKSFHDNAKVPLKHIHVGGEDSPPTAWLNSTHCERLRPLEKEDLYLEIKVNYSMAIGEIAEKEGVQLIALDEFFIAWPSLLPFERIRPFMTPFRRSRFPKASQKFDVLSVSKTYDQLPQGHRAQHMADNDFKVILQPDDYFSLDYAPEPNPNMPGTYSSTHRFINATRVFNFLPGNLCCNYQLTDGGSYGCADVNNCLKLEKTDNIVGIQASLGTRYVRDEATLFKLLSPRIIAYAERAWHKAAWEDTYKVHPISFSPQTGPSVNIQVPDLPARDEDWRRVASVIGNKEFPRMLRNIEPNLLPPGARKNKTMELLHVDTAYPGLVPQVKTPGSATFVNIAPLTDVSKLPHKEFQVKTILPYQRNVQKLKAESIEATMPLVHLSYREEILMNITNIRRQMALEQQRQMERAREMERMRQMNIMNMMRQQQQQLQQHQQAGTQQTAGQAQQPGQTGFPTQSGVQNQFTNQFGTAGQQATGGQTGQQMPVAGFPGGQNTPFNG